MRRGRSATRGLGLLAALVTVATLLPGPAPQAEAALPKPTLLGFATADFRADLPDFTAEAGKPPAIYQLYWPIELDWPNAWAPGMLSELKDLGLTAYVEVTTDDLAALNRGDRDADLNALAKTVGDWVKGGPGRRILIAPLPEMNLVHAWGGNPPGFRSGYARIRQAFLDQGLSPQQVRFVFAANGIGDIGEYDDYYPGDATVDIIGFSKFNRGNPWLDYDATFQMHIDEMQSRVSLTKPILITQTGSTTQNGNRAIWLSDMFAGLKADSQVIGAIYFNRNGDRDYRVLTNGDLDPTFRSGYQQWSDPSQVSWIFDGRMDAWVAERQQLFGAGFLDIQGNVFEGAIKWLAAEGITQGCNPPLNTRFCPDDEVTRGEMAVFIARALGLPSASGDHFNDDGGEFYEEAANRLYEAGITVGCGSGRYCGGRLISREQMAAFLARTLDLQATSIDFFVDDDRSLFEAAINKIAQAGVTQGCNPPTNNRYCPSEFVSRGQMAAFLRRALNS